MGIVKASGKNKKVKIDLINDTPVVSPEVRGRGKDPEVDGKKLEINGEGSEVKAKELKAKEKYLQAKGKQRVAKSPPDSAQIGLCIPGFSPKFLSRGGRLAPLLQDANLSLMLMQTQFHLLKGKLETARSILDHAEKFAEQEDNELLSARCSFWSGAIYVLQERVHLAADAFCNAIPLLAYECPELPLLRLCIARHRRLLTDYIRSTFDDRELAERLLEIVDEVVAEEAEEPEPTSMADDFGPQSTNSTFNAHFLDDALLSPSIKQSILQRSRRPKHRASIENPQTQCSIRSEDLPPGAVDNLMSKLRLGKHERKTKMQDEIISDLTPSAEASLPQPLLQARHRLESPTVESPIAKPLPLKPIPPGSQEMILVLAESFKDSGIFPTDQQEQGVPLTVSSEKESTPFQRVPAQIIEIEQQHHSPKYVRSKVVRFSPDFLEQPEAEEQIISAPSQSNIVESPVNSHLFMLDIPALKRPQPIRKSRGRSLELSNRDKVYYSTFDLYDPRIREKYGHNKEESETAMSPKSADTNVSSTRKFFQPDPASRLCEVASRVKTVPTITSPPTIGEIADAISPADVPGVRLTPEYEQARQRVMRRLQGIPSPEVKRTKTTKEVHTLSDVVSPEKVRERLSLTSEMQDRASPSSYPHASPHSEVDACDFAYPLSPVRLCSTPTISSPLRQTFSPDDLLLDEY